MAVRTLSARRQIQIGRWLVLALAAVVFAAGWVAGVTVRAALWTVDALVVGYRDGRGA